MILKNYQQAAINSLEKFIELLVETNSLQTAYKMTCAESDIQSAKYCETLPGVPQVCFKVPTGGGKTFMAAASLKPIHKKFPSKIIVWLVPSETILTQTYKNLSDANHPYREKISRDFNGQVRVYTKEQLLAGENFSPLEVDGQLSILVLSYDSFRRQSKDYLKVFKENPYFEAFAEKLKDEEILTGEDIDKISLINVIRSYTPIVIVDESHHAKTDLSVEMLKNFNPGFVLELTATPKKTSNVICYVPARNLRDEGMIKIPLVVYNQHMKGDVMRLAISYRNALEKLAVNTNENVRPIVLFQAESKGKENHVTFDKIREKLIDKFKIPAEEIAIKTATINELKGVDLLSADCKIRYIITINALKEGWDCPFAYILASLANRSSAVDVEQIVGRILRRPYTKTFKAEPLNLSYVFTASDDFRQALEVVAAGLNAAGFTNEDYRAIEQLELDLQPLEEIAEEETPPVTESENISVATNSAAENLNDVDDTAPISTAEEQHEKIITEKITQKLLFESVKQNELYTRGTATPIKSAPKIIDSVNEFPMQKEFRDGKILLPQFFLRGNLITLFGDCDEKVSKEVLCKDCTLIDKDATINFDDLYREIAAFDFHDKNSNRLTYKFLSETQAKAMMEHFNAMPLERQIRYCAARIATRINERREFPAYKEIRNFVERAMAHFDRDRLFDAMKNIEAYARRIDSKIDEVLTEYATKNFFAQADSRRIFAKPNYALPETITPPIYTRNMAKALYTAEANDMNGLEYKIITRVLSLENIRWWHRNRAKKEFFINGFINHYPDFLIMTESGVLLIVEVKGDDRDNSDSRQKLNLGKLWESKANSERYAYFMVFDKKPLEGALTLDEFMTRVKML